MTQEQEKNKKFTRCDDCQRLATCYPFREALLGFVVYICKACVKTNYLL